jgi:hypothetical protein
MTDLQSTLAGLMRKNEEYKLQVGVPPRYSKQSYSVSWGNFWQRFEI